MNLSLFPAGIGVSHYFKSCTTAEIKTGYRDSRTKSTALFNLVPKMYLFTDLHLPGATIID